MWLRVFIPQESENALMFEELGIPHEEEEKVEVLLHVNNLLCIAARVDEEDSCWICAADQQALPVYAHFDDVSAKIAEMSQLAHESGRPFPHFLQLKGLMPATAEEAELPNPPLFEHHLLINLDQIFHMTVPGAQPPLVSVGFGAPSLHYELTEESAAVLHKILGMSPS